MTREPGSFRDPAGQVHLHQGRVFRTVHTEFLPKFKAFYESRLRKSLVAEGLLLDAVEVPLDEAPDLPDGAAALLEQPLIPFISYPYEWPFSLLKEAALRHLEIQMRALDSDFVLRDSTPYNMQFHRGKIVFIDILSFEPYTNGEYWKGYSQFCAQFLNPLLMNVTLGFPFHSYFRGSPEGIDPGALARLVPWTCRLKRRFLKHVYLQSYLQRFAVRHGLAAKDVSDEGSKRAMPKSAYRRLLRDMHDFISRLRLKKKGKTSWSDYRPSNSYNEPALDYKVELVREAVAREKPEILWDLGGNTGFFSRIALDAGAKCVAMFEADPDCVETAYRNASGQGLNLLPLVMDLMNPSPRMGWRLLERKGQTDRGPADFFLALALIHHICIGRNVPLGEFVKWISEMGRAGIVEFVPKEDPMTKRLLGNREDIFPEYHRRGFEEALAERFHVSSVHEIPDSDRVLYCVRRTGR